VGYPSQDFPELIRGDFKRAKFFGFTLWQPVILNNRVNYVNTIFLIIASCRFRQVQTISLSVNEQISGARGSIIFSKGVSRTKSLHLP